MELVIDADRLLCSVIWRGRFAVEGMSIVEALRVSAGVEVPGQTLPSAGNAPPSQPAAVESR